MSASTAGRTATVTVAEEQARRRLDKVLAEGLDGLSRSRLKALIDDGNVRVDGATISEADYRVKPGQTIAIFIPDAEDAVPAAQAIDLVILYEDDDIIVIDKPAGLVVHPAPGNPDRTLVNALLAHCGESLSGIGGVRRPGIVHRLDKETSGIMVAAKNDQAHAALSAQFARHAVDRVYEAVVWGAPETSTGRIEGAIGRDPRNRKRMAIVARGGKAAVTRYRVRERYGAVAARVECRLETGRTHQVRVHMAHLGHPLVGDPLYARARRVRRNRLPEGARQALEAFGRQALHARKLGFRHPIDGEKLEFEVAPPCDFRHLTKSLELI